MRRFLFCLRRRTAVIRVAAVALLTLVAACAAPLATREEDRLAKTESVPRGRTTLFVQRKSQFIASGALLSVALNGFYVGDIGVGQFMRFDLLPGEYALSVSGALVPGQTLLYCERGEKCYVQIHLDISKAMLIFIRRHFARIFSSSGARRCSGKTSDIMPDVRSLLATAVP